MNNLIKYIAFLLVLVLCSSLFTLSSAAESNSLDVSARAACLIDADSGRVLYGKSENTRLPMASTTKIMTAILALESGIPLSTVITVPREAVGIEGSSIYLAEGEKITLEALIYGLLLSSANDAAVTIAIAISGSVERFVALMNQKATSLGLSSTSFENPHGLDGDGHYTTARELALLMAYCVKNEVFLEISGTQKRVFPRGEDASRVMINHNRLLREDIGVISGKTGFTKQCGRTLVTCAERDGLRLICVTLNAPSDWNDHKKLYEFGFQSYQRVSFESISLEIPIISGKKDKVKAKSDSVSLFLSRSDGEITYRVLAPRFLFAPAKQGDTVGQVVIRQNGKEIASLPLVLISGSERVKYGFDLFEWLIELLSKLRI